MGRVRPLRSSRPPGYAGKHTLAYLLVLPLLASLALTLGTPAQAAGACSGRPAKTVSFAKGELRVYKSRAYVCAVTVAGRPGARRAMSVSLQARGGRPVVDKGRFTTRAGPVTVYALNRCVRATGAVAGSSGSTGWVLC
ncbi:hypothetical protein [Streptomyces fulvorobeus]|nr:hypothetical protein [Streptomyces fulvorobeus]